MPSSIDSDSDNEILGFSTPPSSVPPSPLAKSATLRTFSLPATVEGADRQCPQLPKVFPQLPINETPLEVADADTQTPDKWVKRGSDLIRLTGKHPFNAEAPVPKLMGAGFFTPAHLHFVRNHGAVPQVDEATFRSWTVRVHGLVSREATFTLQDLKDKFSVVSLPVTLVCAGNRRKEQNVVRKSLGFDWGSAGGHTAMWTGVYLSDVLEYVRPIRGKAKHVIFEGADNLPKGPYGTSQVISWSRSREKGMLLAWAMNGLPLEPDHGFPLRVIIPGQIGGRSVKWLRRIEVSANESQHHLHFWDNKVLPRSLHPDVARNEHHWWYDPSYLITELNVNSAITSPSHGEILNVSKVGPEDMYDLRGYAYSGGGRRVNRCEVSLDEGESWTLAKIEYPEDRLREYAYNDETFGAIDLTERETSFCWCFWSLQVPVSRLVKANVIQLCAMDISMNMQPRDIYLNATSMLNNWLFRVVIRKYQTDAQLQLRFEHPAPVGVQEIPGWMERMKAEGRNFIRPSFSDQANVRALVETAEKVEESVSMTNSKVNRKITEEELASQEKSEPWFVVNGEVYDGTPFLSLHPGGPDSIFLAAGEDASEDFLAIHSSEGRAKLAEYHIGTLVKKETPSNAVQASSTIDPAIPFLNAKQWKRAVLITKTRVNHDSWIFRLALHSPAQKSGLNCGQHVYIRLAHKATGEVVQRAYTPVSDQETTGHIEFLVKLYGPSKKFPRGGKMSERFNQLVVGDEVELKGPVGSFIWTSLGSFTWRGAPRKVKEIGMICAGSGVTPIYQVLRGILHDDADVHTRVWVVCSNRTVADILLREELDEMMTLLGEHRFKIHYTLSRPTHDWKYGQGRINDKTIRDHLPLPSNEGVVLACGPDAMMEETVKPALARCGWDVGGQFIVF